MSYRYLGNKTRIADWITEIVAGSLPTGSVVGDLMCGTAAMSAAFAGAGYRVIAADVQKFAVLHAKARLLSGTPERFADFGLDYAGAIAALNDLPATDGFFFREYSDGGRPANGVRPRKYFTAANAGRIDAMRGAIRDWRRQGLDGLAADLLLHDLILATNRVASIAGTYGYYRAGFSTASRASILLTPTVISPPGNGHRILQGKAEDTVRQMDLDAIYLDPPYTKRQYGGNYHIIETLAQEDEPEAVGEGGLRDWSAQASDFCYRRRTEAAFRAILDNCRARWLFVSYSEDAHLSDIELTALFECYGTVERYDRAHGRFRSNERVVRQGSVREYLYVVEMNDACSVESRRSVVEAADAH